MRTAITVVLCCSVLLIPASAKSQPSPFAPGGDPSAPYRILDRELCWEEPGDPDNWKISSDTILQFDLHSETANDFLLDQDASIVHWIALGGPYCWVEGYDDPSIMNYKFYEDASGVPGAVLLEEYDIEPEKTFIQMGHEGPVHRFEYDTSFPVIAGERYWFVLQAANHPFPPCWGRLRADQITELESMFRGPFWGYDEWTPVHEVVGEFADVVQAFECGAPTPTTEATWSRVRWLYR